MKKISKTRIKAAREWHQWLTRDELKTHSQAITPALKKAATALALDPKDSQQAAIMLRILAALVFSNGKRGRPHASLKWGHEREFGLGYHFDLLRQENPKIKIGRAASAIKRRWPKEYADCSETTLRQRMSFALQVFKDFTQEAEEEKRLEALEAFESELRNN